MKLKRQRQDVKWMRTFVSTRNYPPELVDIARRVSNMILALEETMNGPAGCYTSRRLRVLKDSKEK